MSNSRQGLPRQLSCDKKSQAHSHRNMSETLGKQEMLWEHKPTGKCFLTAFLSSPELS